MSFPAHLLMESYSSAEMQSVYSTAPADWANLISWFLVVDYGLQSHSLNVVRLYVK